MANQKNNTNNNDGDLHSVAALGALVAVGAIANKLIPIIQNLMEDHPLFITMMIMCAIYGLWNLALWRLRKNNPEKYRRKALLDFVEKLWKSPGAIFAGNTTKDGRGVFLSPELRTGHVQILGATGRGKTASVIVPWFLRDMRNNTVPILMDGKGDLSIVHEMAPWAGLLQKSIYHFDPANPELSCTINPLEGGTAHEVADRLFASMEFESSYFKEVQYSAVLNLLELFEHFGEVATLKNLFEALSNPQAVLDRVTGKKVIPAHLTRELMKVCQMKSEAREEKFSGIISQLRPFATGNFERIVNANGLEMNHISLDEAMNPTLARKKGIDGLVILLPTLQYQKTAKALGKLIMQSLAWSTARRQADQEVTPLFIDEFSAFVYEGFEQFLNKARSKGVALHLSHQSMGDLEAISDSFAKTVNVNTNIKVLLGLNDPDTADYFARHLGTFTTTKETERASRSLFGKADRSGEMSIREAEEYKIHPNRLKSFTRGRGVLSMMVNGQAFVEEVQFDSNKAV